MTRKIMEHVHRSTVAGRRLTSVYLGDVEWREFKQEIDTHLLMVADNERKIFGDDVIEYSGIMVIRVAMRSHFGPTFAE